MSFEKQPEDKLRGNELAVWQLRAQSRTYFVSVCQAENDSLYIEIKEKRFRTGQGKEQQILRIFQEFVPDFAEALQAAAEELQEGIQFEEAAF